MIILLFDIKNTVNKYKNEEKKDNFVIEKITMIS